MNKQSERHQEIFLKVMKKCCAFRVGISFEVDFWQMVTSRHCFEARRGEGKSCLFAKDTTLDVMSGSCGC